MYTSLEQKTEKKFSRQFVENQALREGRAKKVKKIFQKNLVNPKKGSNFASQKGRTEVLNETKESENKQPKPLLKAKNDALWCNGSTPDSGSVCEGSSPSKATT